MKHFLTNKYTLPLLLLMAFAPSLFTAIYYGFHEHWCDYWPTFNYFVGYEYGFGGRKLIGSLLGPLMPEMVTAKQIRLFVLPANLLMLLGSAWLVWRCMRQQEHWVMGALLLAYAANPFSIFGFVSSHLSMCFMETYMLLLVILWLLLYVRHRGTWYYYVATLVVPIACCLIHITFCCILFPLILGLMIFDVLGDDRLSRMKAIAYATVLVSLAALFLVLWHWGGMTIDLDTLYDRIASRANQDVLPSKDGLRMLYYTSNTGTSWLAGFSIRFVVELLIYAPLLTLLGAPWVIAARKATRRSEKLRYWLPLLAVLLLTLPIFFRATDYSRWWVCWTFSMAVLPMAALATGDKGLSSAMKTLGEYLKKLWWIPVFVIVFMLQFHVSDRMFFDGLKESELLLDYVSMLF